MNPERPGVNPSVGPQSAPHIKDRQDPISLPLPRIKIWGLAVYALAGGDPLTTRAATLLVFILSSHLKLIPQYTLQRYMSREKVVATIKIFGSNNSENQIYHLTIG